MNVNREYLKKPLAILLTCFNRRDITLRGLASLKSAAGDIPYRVYLVDDGSTDGTGDAVSASFPETVVFRGDGSLFWNGGMRKAWQIATADRPDYYLLLNDDVDLMPGSISRLLDFQREKEAIRGPNVISIGKVIDPHTGNLSYGGYVIEPGMSRLRFRPVSDGDHPCDTMNGNCVLIPARAVDDVGILSDRFTHHMGDIDYGLRASKAGYLLFQLPESVGRCESNTVFANKVSRLTWRNWRFIFFNPKGLSLREWLYFCRTHGGWMWPVNFVVRYLKILRL